MTARTARTATVHRMVTGEHVCPYGIQTVDLLKRKGFEVDDRPLRNRAETDAFKAEHGVETTPQTFIDGERIGGYDQVRQYFGKEPVDEVDERTTYAPVIALFAMGAAIAVAIGISAPEVEFGWRTVKDFVAVSMCLLALQKLQDVRSFATMFLNYDLLAQRWVRYGYVYPFGEGLAGVLMLAAVLDWISIPIAILIGTVGAVSVVKAVYVDKRELKCACVGGNSNVPLGFVSLTENLMMLGMGVVMALT